MMSKLSPEQLEGRNPIQPYSRAFTFSNYYASISYRGFSVWCFGLKFFAFNIHCWECCLRSRVHGYFASLVLRFSMQARGLEL